jgi:hypothetical protein
MTDVLGGTAAQWAVEPIGSLTSVLAVSAGSAPSSWWPSTLVACISLAGVVFVALYNARATRRSEDRHRELAKQMADQQERSAVALEEVRSSLSREQDEASARRTYEFEARKRLYEELHPLLFQLREQSESALFRIYGLAMSARTGRLVPESSKGKENRLHKGSVSYLPSTLYRFMAPLATYRLCEQRLTTVDLSLDDDLQWHYLLAKLLYRSWSDGQEIADISIGAELPPKYAPGSEDPDLSVSAQQHLSVQKIERIIESMLVQPEREEISRCVTLGEFFRVTEGEPDLVEAIKPLRDVFVSFSPESRPVLWRLLIVHAYLYAGLSGRARTIESLVSAFDDEEIDRLSWQDPNLVSNDKLKRGEPFLAAQAYLVGRKAMWRSLATRGGES